MNNRIHRTQLKKLRSLMESGKEFLDTKNLKDDEKMKYTKAITMSVLREYYDLDKATAFNALTEGSEDNGIDGFYYGDSNEELGLLILIQSKYATKDGATGIITEKEIKQCINSAEKIIDGEEFQRANHSLGNKISDYRQKLIDAEIPPITINLFFASNGIFSEQHKGLSEVEEARDKGINIFFVDATQFGVDSPVLKGVINVNRKNSKDKTDSIFSIDEDEYGGLVASCSIRELMIFYEESGDGLLSENVRFLLKNSSINKQIKASFIEDPKRFCYLNNGISIVSSKYSKSSTGLEITKITMSSPSIVNGGQTVASLYQIYTTQRDEYSLNFDEANIILRIYQVPIDYGIKIAQATNSQNPISLVDLHSNDSAQVKVKEFFEKQGVGFIIKGGTDTTHYDDIIKNEAVLQVYASLYCEDPARSKLSKASVFKKYYHEVFVDDISEDACKKLYRCYELGKYITEYEPINESVKKNAFYSIIYTIGKKLDKISNQNIPIENLKQTELPTAINGSIQIINKIIKKREEELGVNFSMNNLFKSREIKYLIDIELEQEAYSSEFF